MSNTDTREWWRHAAVYQVYPRSFADDNGDGIGDLAGIRARLGYLRALGINAIWFSPWYPSPMADAGYDVSDYRDIDPSFGTLDEAERLVEEAHANNLRVIIDIVPNHCSDAHDWFQQALAGGPGAPARDLFWFRSGRGAHGERPPNDWGSVFGGPAWTRVADGEWYLHLFAPEQPDLNWDNPAVRAEFEDILRFWFDRGVDGIRIDSAAMCVKDPELADFDPASPPDPHPFVDRDEIHDIYRGWRAVADSYVEPRVLIGEVWLADPVRVARYLRPDEMHTAFNFEFLGCPWDAKALRACVEATLAVHAPVGAPSTWVLSNHDVTRHVTRYGRADTGFKNAPRQQYFQMPTDRDLGLRRARAAALLTLALPGSVYVYQGDELGLPDVEDLPAAVRQDPIFERTGGADPGRDGSRVPLPWSGRRPPYGFSPDGATASPLLPQPSDWGDLTVAAQDDDPGSTLHLYRAALALRAAEEGLGDGPMNWLEFQNPIFPAFAEAAAGALAKRGFTPVLGTRTIDAVPEADYLDILLEQNASGVIFAGGLYQQADAEHEHYRRLRERGLPAVLINAANGGLGFPSVSTDDSHAVDPAYGHLASLGHKRIGMIVGPADHLPSVRKVAAYQAARSQYQHDGPELVGRGGFSLEQGHAATTRLLTQGATGLICASDVLALGAIRGARRLGLSVPDDVSVIGYDDSPVMTYTEPRRPVSRRSR